MKTNIELAREAGGTAYTNRHIDGSAFAFGPEALDRYTALVEARLMAKSEQKPFFQFRECEDSQAGQPATFKPLGTVYRWTALKDGKQVYQYGEGGYPQLFAKTAVKLPEGPEAQPAQEPLFWYQDGPNGTFVGPIPNEVIEQGRILKPGEWKPLFGAAHGIGGKA